jgi:hypothetical protein
MSYVYVLCRMCYEYDRMSDSDKTVRELQNHIDSKSYTHTYTHTHTRAGNSVEYLPSSQRILHASGVNLQPCSGL